MFYTTDTRKHGLKFDPFKALVVPRPIGWVSTISADGVANLAPFSFFNAISDYPPMLIFSVANGKDTLNNIEATRECTCSIVSHSLVDEMNMSSAPVGSSVSEWDLGNIEMTSSQLVKPPRVAKSPAAFECSHWKTVKLPINKERPDSGFTTVIVTVDAVYIDDAYIKDGLVDTAAMQPLARLGYMDYAVVNEKNMFTLNRPAVSEDGKTATLESGPWDGVFR
ncbi:hypothetical protein AB833_24635 [Chromatiales bacterium (ex Bugula neritina AB1)]|nr:hypothetical protein AB833_24635 [Chromatiales bacterium (ex Bugula neritina AB1)]